MGAELSLAGVSACTEFRLIGVVLWAGLLRGNANERPGGYHRSRKCKWKKR